MKYDLIVIGGGPAGYVGAIRAAQLGKKVACVEKERAGGTCLNWGCIPTKSLLKNAELYHPMKHRAEEFGFKIEGLTLRLGQGHQALARRVGQERGGIEFLFKKNKIDYLRGEALLDEPGEVEVKLADGKTETHSAAKILIATGVVSRPMPGLPFNGKTVIGSREAMILEPSSRRASSSSAPAPSAWSSPISSTPSAPRSRSSKCCRTSCRSRTRRFRRRWRQALTKTGDHGPDWHEDDEDRGDQDKA